MAKLPEAAAAPDIAAQITAREAACNAAYAANDLKTYFGCYAEDMTGLFPDGRTTLAEYRDSWTKMIKAGGHVDQFDYADLKIQVAPGGAAASSSAPSAAATRVDGDREDALARLRAELPAAAGPALGLLAATYGGAGEARRGGAGCAGGRLCVG